MLSRREWLEGIVGVAAAGLTATEMIKPSALEKHLIPTAKARAQAFFGIYRAQRGIVIAEVYRRQESEGRSRDFEEAVEWGEAMIKRLPNGVFDFPVPRNIGTDLYDLHFDSPLVVAAFKEDLDVLKRYQQLGPGALTIKTIMPEDRKGNPRPRWQELPDGSLNALGLPGHGIEKRIPEIDASGIIDPNKPIIISIGGNSIDDYIKVFDHLRNHYQGFSNIIYEINISCPNTQEGQNMIKHPELLDELLAYMRPSTNAIMGVKLSPDMSNTETSRFVELVQKYARTYINIGNTSFKRCEEVGLAPNCTSIGGGGYSGDKLYQISLERTETVAKTGIPFIATGGVRTSERAKRLLDKGATLVGAATIVGENPFFIPLTNYYLAGY